MTSYNQFTWDCYLEGRKIGNICRKTLRIRIMPVNLLADRHGLYLQFQEGKIEGDKHYCYCKGCVVNLEYQTQAIEKAIQDGRRLCPGMGIVVNRRL